MRALHYGRHVFVHAYQNLKNGESEWVTASFFESDDDGKLIEHWDCAEPVPPRDELVNSGKFGEKSDTLRIR